MYHNKVEICGVNTAKLKTLTDEEKRRLLARAKEGDSEARQELIDGNLRLVLYHKPCERYSKVVAQALLAYS